jgi:hypothetical protein
MSDLVFLPWDGPQTKQPRNRAEVIALLGDPTGDGLYQKVADPMWVKKNIVECHGKNAMPGVEKFYFKVHKIVEPYMREAFRRAAEACPGYVRRAGCFVFRHQRHDPKLPLSLHSYGCAVDINADDNDARYFKRGKCPEAWTPEWMKLYPMGIPRGVVDAFKSCGFAWGSDWNEDGATSDETFCDPMHLEFVARDGKQFGV